MKLKVCGLRDQENIMQVLNYQPDYIGFIFYEKSPRYAGKILQADFTQRISSVKKVGVFVNPEMIDLIPGLSIHAAKNQCYWRIF